MGIVSVLTGQCPVLHSSSCGYPTTVALVRSIQHQCGEQNAALKSRAFGPRTAEAVAARQLAQRFVLGVSLRSESLRGDVLKCTIAPECCPKGGPEVGLIFPLLSLSLFPLPLIPHPPISAQSWEPGCKVNVTGTKRFRLVVALPLPLGIGLITTPP